jgi:hypothetical protein
LLEPKLEFPDQAPKLWLIACRARCLPLIGIVRNGQESFQTKNTFIAGGRGLPDRVARKGIGLPNLRFSGTGERDRSWHYFQR